MIRKKPKMRDFSWEDMNARIASEIERISLESTKPSDDSSGMKTCDSPPSIPDYPQDIIAVSRAVNILKSQYDAKTTVYYEGFVNRWRAVILIREYGITRWGLTESSALAYALAGVINCGVLKQDSDVDTTVIRKYNPDADKLLYFTVSGGGVGCGWSDCVVVQSVSEKLAAVYFIPYNVDFEREDEETKIEDWGDIHKNNMVNELAHMFITVDTYNDDFPCGCDECTPYEDELLQTCILSRIYVTLRNSDDGEKYVERRIKLGLYYLQLSDEELQNVYTWFGSLTSPNLVSAIERVFYLFELEWGAYRDEYKEEYGEYLDPDWNNVSYEEFAFLYQKLIIPEYGHPSSKEYFDTLAKHS